MQSRCLRMYQWLEIQSLSRYLMLFILAAVFAGCATTAPPEPEPKEDPGEPLAGGGVVFYLEEGRHGFVIEEKSSMDEETRELFERAVGRLEAQDYDGAIELLETVIGHSPGVTAPYVNIAIALQKVDRFEEAEEHLETALSLVPKHPAANNEYGLLLRRMGRFDEARENYEKTLATFPDYHPARRNLGIVCDLYLNDLQCALDSYETYSDAVPDDDQVEMWIADLRMRLGR